jgi:hypothetical protein
VNWDQVSSTNPPSSRNHLPVIYLETTPEGTTARLVDE